LGRGFIQNNIREKIFIGFFLNMKVTFVGLSFLLLMGDWHRFDSLGFFACYGLTVIAVKVTLMCYICIDFMGLMMSLFTIVFWMENARYAYWN